MSSTFGLLTGLLDIAESLAFPVGSCRMALSIRGGGNPIVGVGLMSHQTGQLSESGCQAAGFLYDPFHDEKPSKTNQPHRFP
jgi:hypothetical protein